VPAAVPLLRLLLLQRLLRLLRLLRLQQLLQLLQPLRHRHPIFAQWQAKRPGGRPAAAAALHGPLPQARLRYRGLLLQRLQARRPQQLRLRITACSSSSSSLVRSPDERRGAQRHASQA
jgi:hypothetical protein